MKFQVALLSLIISLIGCSKPCKEDRDFFPEMISYKARKDISKQGSVTSIWLSKKPVKINQHCYFELVNENQVNSIMLSGYLRKENEKILIYPTLVDSGSIDTLEKDYILIDFNSKIGDSWNICSTSDGYYCQKLKLLNVKYDSLINDSAYLIKIDNYTIIEEQFIRPSDSPAARMMYLSKKKGIIAFGIQSMIGSNWYYLKQEE